MPGAGVTTSLRLLASCQTALTEATGLARRGAWHELDLLCSRLQAVVSRLVVDLPAGARDEHEAALRTTLASLAHLETTVTGARDQTVAEQADLLGARRRLPAVSRAYGFDRTAPSSNQPNRWAGP